MLAVSATTAAARALAASRGPNSNFAIWAGSARPIAYHAIDMPDARLARDINAARFRPPGGEMATANSRTGNVAKTKTVMRVQKASR